MPQKRGGIGVLPGQAVHLHLELVHPLFQPQVDRGRRLRLGCVPRSSRPSLGHSHEGLCTWLKNELQDVMMAESIYICRETEEHQSSSTRRNRVVALRFLEREPLKKKTLT